MRSDMCQCVCVCLCMCVWVGNTCMFIDVRGGAFTWTMPMFLANPPIQADINAIDCNWAVMCGI